VLRYTVKRWGKRWLLEIGDKRGCVLSSPDRSVIVGAAHAILRAYDGVLVVYDMFHCVEAAYAYRDGTMRATRTAPVPLGASGAR
jgi:hypothetical protein